MNKTSVIPPQPNPQNPSNSKKKNKNQPSTDQSDAPTGQTKRNQNSVAPTGEDGPKASKKMKHADVPEECELKHLEKVPLSFQRGFHKHCSQQIAMAVALTC